MKSMFPLYLVVLGLGACGVPLPLKPDLQKNKQNIALIDASAKTLTVYLKSTVAGQYLVAENGGGGEVNVNRSQAQAWETFKIIDKNGGSLVNGDLVYIQAYNGQFLQVSQGTGTRLNAASKNSEAWETFRIKASGNNAIKKGSIVGFQSISSNRYISAMDGGGKNALVQGVAFDAWEKFVVEIPGQVDYGSTNPDPNAGGNTQTPEAPQGWKLVWSDEFNGSAIDTSKWAFEVQKPGWVNNELQNYTNNRRENARIENGSLVIEGRRDYFNGFEYSSARLKTQGKASWKYRRVEALIKVPTGYGTWPAFWMMPDDFSRGWPACGEIDIMEHVGYDPNVIHATTHANDYNWKSGQQRTSTLSVPGAVSDYHVYAMEWYADRIDMFVDGKKYFTSTNNGTGDNAWPFNKNFYIILNLAIGGDWGAAKGVDPNIWPKQMLVDYVRVYQK